MDKINPNDIIDFDSVEEWAKGVPSGTYLLRAYFDNEPKRGTELRVSKKGDTYVSIVSEVRADLNGNTLKGMKVYDTLQFTERAIGRTKGLLKGILGDKYISRGTIADYVRLMRGAEFTGTVSSAMKICTCEQERPGEVVHAPRLASSITSAKSAEAFTASATRVL